MGLVHTKTRNQEHMTSKQIAYTAAIATLCSVATYVVLKKNVGGVAAKLGV